jgi:hypothetical protein
MAQVTRRNGRCVKIQGSGGTAKTTRETRRMHKGGYRSDLLDDSGLSSLRYIENARPDTKVWVHGSGGDKRAQGVDIKIRHGVAMWMPR